MARPGPFRIRQLKLLTFEWFRPLIVAAVLTVAPAGMDSLSQASSRLFACTTQTSYAGASQLIMKLDCPKPPPPPSASSNSEADQSVCTTPTCCVQRPIDEPADSDRWAGRTSSDGSFVGTYCYLKENDGTGSGGLVQVDFIAAANAPPPPPSPAALAQQAINQILVPPPAISAGPDRTKLAVNLWTWLWIDEPGPLVATVAAGGVSVTATATLTSVTWSLGEPAPTGGPYAPGPPFTITCPGTGSAPPANYDWKAEPPCGHKYTWMSTADRTGGSGKWPVTATTNWTVTWQSNTGVTGSGTLNATGTDALEIGEYRVVLVQGAGG